MANAAMDAEIKRKASLGLPLQNPTPESTALYDGFKKSMWEAEVKRKAMAGEPLQNSTPEAEALYAKYKPSGSGNVEVKKSPDKGMSSTTTAENGQPAQEQPASAVGQLRFQNVYLADAQKLMTQLQQLTSTPFTYTQEQLQADPTFQAAQTLARQGAATAQKNTLETMNDRGIANSSITSSQLGQIAQQAELKPLELVPQLQQQAFSQHQTGIQNQMALANALLNAGIDERTFQSMLPMQEAALTGQYLPGDARALIDTILNLKKQAGTAAPGDIAGLQSQADDARKQLNTFGIDADALFGSGVTLDQATQNVSKAGQMTTEAQTALLNTILGLGQTYGELPAGAGNAVSGLPMYSGVANFFGGLEGKSTLAKEGQQFDQKMAELDFSFKTEDAAQKNAISRANVELSRIKVAQDADYQKWLKEQKIEEGNAGKATQGYISQILNEPDRDSATKYIVENADAISADGANISEILDALNSKYPTPNDANNPGKNVPAVDPVTEAALGILMTNPAFDPTTPQGQAELAKFKAILAGQAVQ